MTGVHGSTNSGKVLNQSRAASSKPGGSSKHSSSADRNHSLALHPLKLNQQPNALLWHLTQGMSCMRCRSVQSIADSASMPGHSAAASSKPSGSSKRSGSATSNESLAWLVLEFCDKGCLQVCCAALMM